MTSRVGSTGFLSTRAGQHSAAAAAMATSPVASVTGSETRKGFVSRKGFAGSGGSLDGVPRCRPSTSGTSSESCTALDCDLLPLEVINITLAVLPDIYYIINIILYYTFFYFLAVLPICLGAPSDSGYALLTLSEEQHSA